MLHAAAMLVCLFVIGVLALQQGAGAATLLLAGASALGAVLFAMRFGGIGRTTFSAPQVVVLSASRFGAVMRGALTTMRAAAAADVTLKPALVRIKTRAMQNFTKAVIAEQISAAPGAVVVEADAEGALIHVLDEDSVDAVELGHIEAQAIGALERGAAS